MKRKLLCLLLALILMLGTLPTVSAASDSGVWGKNITWSFNADTGRLTLTGSGKMEFDHFTPSWLRHKSQIRSVVVGEGITNLCDYAFDDCEVLTDVSLPASLRRIDSRAFAECVSLGSIALPAGLYDIGPEAFLNCGKLEAVVLPQGLAYIGEKAFQYCASLTAIDIPGSVHTLHRYFLAGCTNLRTVTLHPGLEVIGAEAFRGINLDTLTLPDTVTTIERDAFRGSSLQSVTLSEGLKVIGAGAFEDCGRLTALTLPASLEYVEQDALSGPALKILVVKNPQCRFRYLEGTYYGITGMLGPETDVYGDPGSEIQKLIDRFPDCPYTFKPLYFDDVVPGVWYFDAVSFAREHSLFQGVGARSFAPERAMSRGMVVQVLYNLSGNGAKCANPFTDVPESAWFADAVCWAAQEGVVNGLGDGRFAPEAPVTREQFAVIMQRFTRRQGIPAEGGAELSAFPDAGAVSDWAAEALGWAVEEGILTGSAVNGRSYLRPGATATRAQVAAIMMRCVNLWDRSTHTDLCIGLVYPRNLTEAFEQAAADYTARHPEVRVRFVNVDVMTYDTALDFSEADALLWLDESVREKYAIAGQTAAAPVLRSPYVLMLRPGLAEDPASMEELAALLKAKKYALGAPEYAPARAYCTDLLAEYGLSSGDIPWQRVQSMEELAFYISFGQLDMGVGTECLARKERLQIPEDLRRDGRGETLYAYYPETSPKKDALMDFFAELRAGQFEALFAPLGLYPIE